MKITYFILGIRPNAKILYNKLTADKKYVKLIQFDGTNEKIPARLLNEEISIKLCRKFSTKDYACAYVHYLAYQKSVNSDWYVYFEDDVIISNLNEIETICNNFEQHRPTLITFNEFESKLPMKYTWWYRPYRSHAYALNADAVTLITKYYDQIITGPDWPFQWEYLVDFYNYPTNDVKLDQSFGSLLATDRNNLQIDMLSTYRGNLDSLNNIFPTPVRELGLVKKMVKLIIILRRSRQFYLHLKTPTLMRLRSSFSRAICENHYLK